MPLRASRRVCCGYREDCALASRSNDERCCALAENREGSGVLSCPGKLAQSVLDAAFVETKEYSFGPGTTPREIACRRGREKSLLAAILSVHSRIAVLGSHCDGAIRGAVMARSCFETREVVVTLRCPQGEKGPNAPWRLPPLSLSRASPDHTFCQLSPPPLSPLSPFPPSLSPLGLTNSLNLRGLHVSHGASHPTQETPTTAVASRTGASSTMTTWCQPG